MPYCPTHNAGTESWTKAQTAWHCYYQMQPPHLPFNICSGRVGEGGVLIKEYRTPIQTLILI